MFVNDAIFNFEGELIIPVDGFASTKLSTCLCEVS